MGVLDKVIWITAARIVTLVKEFKGWVEIPFCKEVSDTVGSLGLTVKTKDSVTSRLKSGSLPFPTVKRGADRNLFPEAGNV